MTNADMTGAEKELTASSDPQSSIAVRLELDDAGTPLPCTDDGGFVEVDSQDVDTVLPDTETHWRILNPGCAEAYPAQPYGVYMEYFGEVSRAGYQLSFGHCEIREEESSKAWIEDGCGLPWAATGETVVLSGNRWDRDHVGYCSHINFPLSECTSSARQNWQIRAPGGAYHTYATPLFEFKIPAGANRHLSDMTATRTP